jgi:predicted DNA-binding transcriptional regulator YafY
MRSTQLHRQSRQARIKSILIERKIMTAERLATELGVTERTIYRDVDELQSMGATIVGESGKGYRWYGEAA